MNIYDVYPYSEGSLPEFDVMHEQPSWRDCAGFVGAVVDTLESNTTYMGLPDTEKTMFWLPEGMIYVSDQYTEEGLETGMSTFRVELDIFQNSDPNGMFREIEIRQTAQGFGGLLLGKPKLVDWGVESSDNQNDAIEMVLDMHALRREQPPSHLPMQPKTLTEDFDAAVDMAHITDILGELSGDELRNIANASAHINTEPKITVCSKRTLLAITQLLRELLPS